MDVIEAEVLIDGAARGRILRLGAALGFWGGVDPASGEIVDPRHPDRGRNLGGRILVLPATRGSSSSSAVLLELLAKGRGPAALVLGARDAILPIGVIVAREMEIAAIPVLLLPPDAQTALPDGAEAAIEPGGRIRLEA